MEVDCVFSMSNPNPSDTTAEERAVPTEAVKQQLDVPASPAPAESTGIESPPSDISPKPVADAPEAPVEPAAASSPSPKGTPKMPGAPTGGAETPSSPPPDVSVADETSFADMLSAFEGQHHADPIPGTSLQGTVIGVSGNSVFVDVGLKREGVLPLEQFLDEEGTVTVKPGDTITVNATGSVRDGCYELSTAQAERPRDWSGLEKAFDEGSVVSGVVTGMIKGGFHVDVGARAFMPASRSGTRDTSEMEALVGQEIRCKIIQLDTAKEDVVVDRRAVLQEEAAAAKAKALSELVEGSVVKGTVRSLTDFGAFIDLGGIDGLLHVADMAWSRVKKPSDLLSVGDEVEVKILKVNPQTRRVSLGRKQLVPDPWSLVEEKYKVGQRVHGTVVRTTDFGAFVQLEPGVDGLIHISEMSWSKKVKKPSEIVHTGETVEVVVLSVNANSRRIGLGLKQALGDPWEDVEKKFTVGSVHEVKIGNMAKFGAFVELAEGIEGMIHISDITNEKRLDHPQEVLKEGQQVKAVVLEIDRSRNRVRLGMKQLEPTSADEYIAEHKVGDIVTGRMIDVRKKSGRVELGEGVSAICRIDSGEQEAARKQEGAEAPDLSALTAMLSERWKGGGASVSQSAETLQAGQVRSFRITSMDPKQKKIEVEPAE